MRIEPTSDTWRVVSTRAEHDLARAKASLEQSGIDHAQTEHLRGRIAALRTVLGWATATPEPTVETTNYGI